MIRVSPFSMPTIFLSECAKRDASSFEFNLRPLFAVGEACLRGEPDGRVGGAEQVVVAALDDLKEKTILEGPGVNVEELSPLRPIVEHAERAHASEQVGG